MSPRESSMSASSPNAPSRISVIVITYNWPDALEAVLRALARQSELPHEVIVTDDGSRTDTRERLQLLARDYPVRLVHLWQPDDGARMSRARNRGIAAAQSDYILLLDGDMLAGERFVADHRRFARGGCFVQGSRVLADEDCSQRLLTTGELDLGVFARGIQRRRNALQLPWLAQLNARPHLRRGGTKSCNMGFWRDDLLRLNGFNEAMTGWGREDTELVTRAFHAGLHRRDLRFGGVAVHLWHRTRKRMQNNPNDALLSATEASGVVRCEQGLDQHLADFTEAPADLRQS